MILNKKMFVYDMDGTLLTTKNKVHPYTQQVILEAQRQKHINVIATGRGLQKVLPLINDGTIKGISFLVCSNGALIYDLKKQKATILGKVSPDVYNDLEKFAVENELIISVDTEKFSGSWIPSTQGNDFPYWVTSTQIMDMDLVNRCTKEELRKLVFSKDAVITQIAIRNPKSTAENNTKIVKDFIGLGHNVCLTNSIYTDVNPLGISKYNGIKKLLFKTFTFKWNLVTFGDSGNDKEMLQQAKLGFAVGNATQEAKESASEVIGDHNTGAIGETVKRFLKI